MDLDEMELKETRNKKGLKKNIDRKKLEKIIYPNPDNCIPIEIQTSEWYKKLIKFMEE